MTKRKVEGMLNSTAFILLPVQLLGSVLCMEKPKVAWQD